MGKLNANLVMGLVALGIIGLIAGLIIWRPGALGNFAGSAQSQLAAAVTPSLGTANTFGILSSTFTRNSGSTSIVGDLGYTTLGGGGSHTLTGSTYIGGGVGDATYQQAGTDQGTALTALAVQSCTFTFANGAIDLSTDTTHGTIGVYTPGVYCTGAASAASIGTGGITLRGAGTYIFRVTGAFTTAANSQVTLDNGASSCDVFWTPTAATTLGANSTFKGVVIDASGISIGSTVNWTGRALAFGGTVVADTDTITSTCATADPSGGSNREGTINVVKVVINDNGGTKTVADFPLFVNGVPVLSGVTNTFPAPADVYSVTETNDSNYVRTFSGGCDVNGRIGLNPGDFRLCVVTNDDIGAPAVVPPVPPLIEVVKVPSPLALPAGPGPVVYTYTVRNMGTVPMTNVTMVGDTCTPITLVSGDTNADAKLDVNEAWVHTCSTTLSVTHTNTVVATGWANGLSAVDVASATVVVGQSIVPPLIHVTKVPSPLALRAGGGRVTYAYTVTNPGTAALRDVSITDDKCTGLPGRVVGHPGDLNKNDLLESNESWSFTCETELTRTTTNTGTVSGSANGLTATDFAIATVVVSAPSLPNTGLPSEGRSSARDILMLCSIFLGISVVGSFILGKRAM